MNTFLEAACLLDLPVLMHYILNVKKVILLFLFLTLNTLVLLSNDGSYSIMGSAGSVLIPVKNNAISMQKEDIKMDVYKHQDICSYKIMYDCTFYFINETDKIQRVTIGFPHRLNSFVGWDYETPIHQEITAPTTPVFRDFKFIIDGKEVTYWSYRTGKNDALKDVPAYDVVCAVNVTFAPGEKRIIRNTFFRKSSWDGRPHPMGGTYSSTTDFRSFGYILKSGLTWKGPIGEADITITFHVPPDYLTMDVSPLGYHVSYDPHRFHFHYEDFTPTNDISVSFDYKKMTVEKKARLINKYLKEKDYDNAYYQLENYDVATLNGKKTKETKNIIRKLAYKTAEKLYRRDPGKVIELYKIALHHTYSYSSKDYFTFEYLNADFIKSTPFAEWEQEGEANAPCYYIAYNLACIHAISGDIYNAKMWLDMALKMNPKLSRLVETDSDLENLKEETNPLIIALSDHRRTLFLSNIKKYLKKEYINDKDNRGRTPLMLVFYYFSSSYDGSFTEIIKAFIDNGADPSAKDWEGQTVFHYAVKESYRKEELKFFDLLVEYGADPCEKDNTGKTPLMIFFSTHYYNVIVLEKLLEYSCISMQDNHGATVLNYMIRNRPYKDVIPLLLKAGADVNITDSHGKTALHSVCSRFSYVETPLRLLLPHIENINQQDIDGKTAMIHLLERYNSDNKKELLNCLSILVNAGADPWITDLRGLSAYDLAAGQAKDYLLDH